MFWVLLISQPSVLTLADWIFKWAFNITTMRNCAKLERKNLSGWNGLVKRNFLKKLGFLEKNIPCTVFFLLLVCIFVCAMEAINRQSWIRAHTHHLQTRNRIIRKEIRFFFKSLRLVRFYVEVNEMLCRCRIEGPSSGGNATLALRRRFFFFSSRGHTSSGPPKKVCFTCLFVLFFFLVPHIPAN